CAVRKCHSKGHTPDDFLERLDTFRLPGNYIAAKFTFTTRKYTPFRSANVPTRPPHYDLFPKIVGEIVSAFNISELRLSLTQGSWRNTLWGDTADFSSPAGAEDLALLSTIHDNFDFG
uniref:Uncharacterized protein n=1 Tax=Romanomermis culicivorax TaxID=13658 RepID=A0A915JWS7_ROMCU